MNEGAIFVSSRRCLRALVVAVLLVGIAGCGQSGPLTLPGKHGKSTAATQPQNQTKQSDEDTKKKKNESDTSENGR